MQARIADPRFRLAKPYWVQVEDEPDDGAPEALRRGVRMKGGVTRAASVEMMDEPGLQPRGLTA